MFILRFFICLCICFVYIFSYDSMEKDNEFSKCQKAFDAGAWISAERLLTEYLRKEVNAERSWQAWLLLIRLSRKTNMSNEITLNYLNDMLNDFNNNAEKRKFILAQIAFIKENLNDTIGAIEVWEKYSALDNVTPDELFVAYKHLIRHYFRLGKFEDVEIILTDCSVLPIAPQKTAYCVYNLADLKAGLDELDESENLLLSLFDLDLDDYTKAQASFLYADILEQKKKYKDSLKYFVQSKDNYGNKEVVALRIASLKKRLKIK